MVSITVPLVCLLWSLGWEGKKPNSFSVSLSHSRYNFSANKYRSSYGYGNSGYGYGYSPYGYSPYSSGYSPYGYGYNNYYPQVQYNFDAEGDDTSDDQIWETTALALGYGYRLSWPDDYFTRLSRSLF